MRPAPALLAALLLAGCAGIHAPPAARGGPAPAAAADPPKGMQWLYGSAEASALSQQAYRALVAYVEARVADRRAGRPVRSAVLQPGAELAAPRFVDCGARPLAVMLDVDETVLLNLGFEYDDARAGVRPWDEARWARWEREDVGKVVPVPGAREAFDRLRPEGVAIIFNSNRDAANGAITAQALVQAGVGPAVAGDTLWLKGDVAPGSGKDPRRLKASERYCIVALAGDQLGDFSDEFAKLLRDVPARRAAAGGAGVGALWGAGWFVLPNPVYGTGTIGGWDAVFPPGRRWQDPGPAAGPRR